MNVIIACEFSGVVRDAFIRHGHDAISCDLLSSERPGPHIQADIRTVDLTPFDLMIAHPPCTYLASSGARWWKGRKEEQLQALRFAAWLLCSGVPRIALENPVGLIGTTIGPADQIIQPWMFGHGETKATCLWLKNLPELKPTKISRGRNPRCHHESPHPERWKLRSRTLTGIADAMAVQWGSLPVPTS